MYLKSVKNKTIIGLKYNKLGLGKKGSYMLKIRL